MIASSDYSIYSNDIAMIAMVDLIVMIAPLDLDKSFRYNLMLLPLALSEQFNKNFFSKIQLVKETFRVNINWKWFISNITADKKHDTTPKYIPIYLNWHTVTFNRNFPSVKVLSRLDSDIIRTSIYPSIISFCWSSLFLTELMLRCAKIILSTLFLGKIFNLLSGNPTK